MPAGLLTTFHSGKFLSLQILMLQRGGKKDCRKTEKELGKMAKLKEITMSQLIKNFSHFVVSKASFIL